MCIDFTLSNGRTPIKFEFLKVFVLHGPGGLDLDLFKWVIFRAL